MPRSNKLRWTAALLIALALPAVAQPPSTASAVMAGALVSPGPSPTLGAAAHDYDWLIGGWDVQVTDYDGAGHAQSAHGEWYFSWVLDGRAVQDVWISPPRRERGPHAPANNRYGTSLRVYDPALRAWRITWENPQTGVHNALIGRRQGKDIVQIGIDDDGRPIRWIFTDIRADSATWRGEKLQDDGSTWRLQALFRLERMRGGTAGPPR
ncbi:MAG TPA: hypothetical protein VF216_07505 [Mizugakiibacter sp.]